jgi:hypothetical protein
LWEIVYSDLDQACAIDLHYKQTESGPLNVALFIVCMASHPEIESDPGKAGNQCADNIWFLDEWRQLDICATSSTNEMKNKLFVMKKKTEVFMEDNELTSLTCKS